MHGFCLCVWYFDQSVFIYFLLQPTSLENIWINNDTILNDNIETDWICLVHYSYLSYSAICPNALCNLGKAVNLMLGLHFQV